MAVSGSAQLSCNSAAFLVSAGPNRCGLGEQLRATVLPGLKSNKCLAAGIEIVEDGARFFPEGQHHLLGKGFLRVYRGGMECKPSV